MKKLPLPIRVPYGYKPFISQAYGNTSLNDWYAANGIKSPWHTGIDVCFEPRNDLALYGAEVIMPCDGWVVKKTFTEPMSTGGNGVTIQTPVIKDDDGIEKCLQIVVWHLSRVHGIGAYKKGDRVGLGGNSGLVSPTPTAQGPVKGAHFHIMAFEFHIENGQKVLQNANNGCNGAVDPLKYIDIDVYETGPETPIEYDAPAFAWALDKMGLTEPWEKIVYLVKNFYKGK